MTLTIKVNSKFGNSEEAVELKSIEEYDSLKRKLKRLHARDSATVVVSAVDFFEQVC